MDLRVRDRRRNEGAQTRDSTVQVIARELNANLPTCLGAVLGKCPRHLCMLRRAFFDFAVAALHVLAGKVRVVRIPIAVPTWIAVDRDFRLRKAAVRACLLRLLFVLRLNDAGIHGIALNPIADNGQCMTCVEIEHGHKGHPFPLCDAAISADSPRAKAAGCASPSRATCS